MTSFSADFRRLWEDHFADAEWPGEAPALIYLFNKLTELRGLVEPHAALPMRTQAEIVHAHDILANLVIHRESAIGIDTGVIQRVADFACVLCWILRHEHNRVFATSLERLDRYLANESVLIKEEKGAEPYG